MLSLATQTLFRSSKVREIGLGSFATTILLFLIYIDYTKARWGPTLLLILIMGLSLSRHLHQASLSVFFLDGCRCLAGKIAARKTATPMLTSMHGEKDED